MYTFPVTQHSYSSESSELFYVQQATTFILSMGHTFGLMNSVPPAPSKKTRKPS